MANAIDRDTRNATAFSTFAALVAACKGGYVPTLVQRADDSAMTRASVRSVRFELESLGLQHWGSEQDEARR